MLIDFIVNFCMLFTFAILTYLPLQNKLTIFKTPIRLQPYILGILSGLTGYFLMLKTVDIFGHIIVDGRLAVIALSGIFGGPIAPFISGVIIGLSRMFIFGFSTSTFIAGANTICVALVISLCMLKKPMTFQNTTYYFAYSAFQTAIVIAYLNNWSVSSWIQVVAFLLFSAASFSIVFLTLKQLSQLFDKIRQIEEMSETDYLTGLNNNRKFQEYAHRLLKESDFFSLVLIDVDHFKRVNDTYGHPIGDEVLKELSLRLVDASKPYNGIVSRNGGEEFSVLLPKSHAGKSISVAELIRKEVENKPFRISTGEDLIITVSAGMSTFPENGNEINKLYQLADEALYVAKSTGRNRVWHISTQKK